MKKNIKTVLAVLVLCLAAGLAALVLKVQRDADREVIPEAGTSLHADHSSRYLTLDGEDYPVLRRISTVLLIGKDSYQEEIEQRKHTFYNYNTDFADFLTILVFDHDLKTVTPFLVNRDTMCEVPWLRVTGKLGGYETEQITYAHTYGSGREDSCENTVNAVRRLLFDAPIDRYLAFTMDAVPVMNDLVGGVTVVLEEDMPELGGEYVKGAEIHLRGSAALRFVRTRDHYLVEANFFRMLRQQQYLEGFTLAAREAAAENQDLAVEAFRAIDRFLCTNLTVNNISEMVEDLCEYEILPVITPGGKYEFDGTHAQFYPSEVSLWQCVYDAFCEKV